MTHIKDEVGKMMPKQELHTHNSIPSYTADLDEGCVICSHNKILENTAEHLAKRVASDFDVAQVILEICKFETTGNFKGDCEKWEVEGGTEIIDIAKQLKEKFLILRK